MSAANPGEAVRGAERASLEQNGAHRLGPVLLADGVRTSHAASFIFAAIVATCITVSLNTLQPYVLAENLALPKEVHGRVSGNLLVLHELIVIAFVGLLGSWSDRVGRRVIFASGLALFASGLVLYPLCMTLEQLTASRVVVSAGAACISATLATIAADYPRNESRGRMLSMLMFTQQLAVVLIVANVAARLPKWLQSYGLDPVTAGRGGFWLIATVGILGALVAARGLRGHVVTGAAGARPRGLEGFVQDVRTVLAAARRNRRLAFVFPVAVVARGDAVIVSAFLSLWIVSGARDQGVDAAAALAHAGTALGAFTGGGLAGTLAAGYAVDRFDRAKTAMLAVLATGLAFGAAALVDDVMGWELVALAAVMGFAELSLIVSGQALLGEQAPPEIRGATVGVFAFCGAVSMLVLSGLGGQVFDRWTYAGPFILAGGLNLLVASWAWMGRREMAMNERTEHG